MQTTELDCPLCMEPLEIDDVNFYPCTCGYQVCRFCWHRIRTDENGLCPACRKAYSEDPAIYTPLTQDEIQTIIRERKQKDTQRKQKLTENRKHLANVRVVQKNLVFVVGLTQRLADTELLKRPEYFGKFGKIHKIVINNSTNYAGPQGPSASAYITFNKEEDAYKAILAVSNAYLDGRTLKTSLGTTKYCSYFLKNIPCPKPDCMYLHEFGDEAASFTKEAMQAGKHQEYEQQLLANYAKKMGINTDKVSRDLWQVGSAGSSSAPGWTLKSDVHSISSHTNTPHIRDSPPGFECTDQNDDYHEPENWEVPSPITVPGTAQLQTESAKTETETQQTSSSRTESPLQRVSPSLPQTSPQIAPPPSIGPPTVGSRVTPPNAVPTVTPPVVPPASIPTTSPPLTAPQTIAQSISQNLPHNYSNTGWPLNPTIDAPPGMNFTTGSSLFGGSGDLASGLGLSNLHLKIAGEDDLGFDPWNESSKGLADLLQEEVKQESPYQPNLNPPNPTPQSIPDFLPGMGLQQMTGQTHMSDKDDFKNWQEGLRALLPNINISFSDGLPSNVGWPAVTTSSRSKGPSEWSPASHANNIQQTERPAVRPPPGFESKTPDPRVPVVDDPSIVWSKVIGPKADPIPAVSGFLSNGYPGMSAAGVPADLPSVVAVQSSGMLNTTFHQSTPSNSQQTDATITGLPTTQVPSTGNTPKPRDSKKPRARPVSEPFATGGAWDPSMLRFMNTHKPDNLAFSQMNSLSEIHLDDPPLLPSVPLAKSLESVRSKDARKKTESNLNTRRERKRSDEGVGKKGKVKTTSKDVFQEVKKEKVEALGSKGAYGPKESTSQTKPEETMPEKVPTKKTAGKKVSNPAPKNIETRRDAQKHIETKQAANTGKEKDRTESSKKKKNKTIPKSSTQTSSESLEDLAKFTEAADILQVQLEGFLTDADVLAEHRNAMSLEVQSTLDKLRSQATDAVAAANGILQTLTHADHARIKSENLDLLTRQVISAKDEAEAAERKLKSLISANSRQANKNKKR